MIKSIQAQLLLKIRQIAGNRSIVSFNRTHVLDDFLHVLEIKDAAPQSIAKVAAKDHNLSSTILAVANKSRRDLSTAAITDLEKAVIRIGRLGCAEAVSRLERIYLEKKCSKDWFDTLTAIQNLSDAATSIAKKRAISEGANLVDAVFLTSLYSAGSLSQVLAASELKLPLTPANRKLVIKPESTVTSLTLQALKMPMDIIARVQEISSATKDDPEALIAKEVWNVIWDKFDEGKKVGA